MADSKPTDSPKADAWLALRDAEEIELEPGEWQLIEPLPERLHFRVPRLLVQLRHALKTGRADFLEELCDAAEAATAPPVLLMSTEEMKRTAARAIGSVADELPRRRLAVECVGQWLESVGVFEGSSEAQQARFLLVKGSLSLHADAFVKLQYAQAMALVKPPRGRTGAVGVTSRWSFAVGAFGDLTQAESDRKFAQAKKDGAPARRGRSRAK